MSNRIKKIDKTIIPDFKRDYLFNSFVKRTTRKSKECYIVNAIWQRLLQLQKLKKLDLIQPVTQRLVRTQEGESRFVDLYFPKINLGIECNEFYHKLEEQKTFDQERNRKISEALSNWNNLLYEDPYGLNNYKRFDIDATQSLEEIQEKVEEVVNEILKRQKLLGKNVSWKDHRQEMDEIKRIKRLKISKTLDQQIYFARKDVFELFDLKPTIRCTQNINDEYLLWLPTLSKRVFVVENSAGEVLQNLDGEAIGEVIYKPTNGANWINILEKFIGSDNTKQLKLIEKNVSEVFDRGMSKVDHNRKRITFLKVQDSSGLDSYIFIGIFKFVKDSVQGPDKDGYKSKFSIRCAEGIEWDSSLNIKEI